MLKSLIYSICFLAIFCQADFRPDNIMPEKGYITKNIHMVFDRSCSMTIENYQAGYTFVSQVIGQNTDEFNLAASAFGLNYQRFKIKDPECKLGPNWMAMPSMENFNRTMSFLQTAPVHNAATNLTLPLKRALDEKVDNLTIVVVSDCIFTSERSLIKLISGIKKNIHVVFIDIDSPDIDKEIYKLIKKNNWKYVSLAQ